MSLALALAALARRAAPALAPLGPAAVMVWSGAVQPAGGHVAHAQPPHDAGLDPG